MATKERILVYGTIALLSIMLLNNYLKNRRVKEADTRRSALINEMK